jgi:hypothetical protein
MSRVHPELHVRLACRLLVNHELQIVTVVSDSVLLEHVAQCNDVSDSLLAILPYVLVIAFHSCFSFYDHVTTVAPELYCCFAIVDVLNQCSFGEEVHGKLAVQGEYDLLEVELYLGAKLLSSM